MNVCLTMIVKNEAHVIERCLRSALPLIDSWCIVDTGSTDGTQALIKEILKDIPGDLHERPWRNFGHNRTEAIALACEHLNDPRSQTYLLFLDADEEIVVAEGFKWPDLTADAYSLEMGNGNTRYWREVLVSANIPWRYEGVLHEYLTTDHSYKTEKLHGPLVAGHFDGGRSQGIDTAGKYRRDAEVLEKAIQAEPDNRRYVFYLAQSYRDSDQPEKAIETYRRRTQMGGWDEEIWYSMLQIAKLTELLFPLALTPTPVPSSALISERYLAAYEFRPRRAEPLVYLAAFHREHNEFALAHLYAERAMAIPRPDDILFLDEPCYAWRAQDEYSIAAYYMGLYEESKIVCEALLASSTMPKSERERVTTNLNFAKDAIA